MATKPSNPAEWGTGAAPITEPLLAEKQAGWSVASKPPAQWMNWWMKLVHQWILWLQAFESDVHTWVALQTFNAGILTASFSTTPGTRGTTNIAAVAAIQGTSTNAAAGVFGTSNNANGTGGTFTNTAGTGLGNALYAEGRNAIIGTGTFGAGVSGGLQSTGDPVAGAGVIGYSAVLNRPGVRGQGDESFGAVGGEFVGSDSGESTVIGGLGLRVRGGASSLTDPATNAGDGFDITGGLGTGDGSLGVGSNAGRGGVLRGGSVDGNLNDEGEAGTGLDLAGGDVIDDGSNRRGGTGLRVSGGVGQAGRGLALDAIGDSQLQGNVKLTGGAVAANVAQVNQLSPGLLVKAWAKVRISSSTYTVLGGQNVTSASAGTAPTSGIANINLASPIPRSSRGIMILAEDGNRQVDVYDFNPTYGANDSTITVQCLTKDSAGNLAALNLTSGTVVFTIIVLGFQ